MVSWNISGINVSEKGRVGLTIKHRDDIDGLRSLAIIPVLLFHFNFGVISGGFTGVDLFFVISGFVIANSIVSDTKSGTFSISNFYFKRIRRIAPAYISVLVVVMLFSCIFLLPDDLIDFSKSMTSSGAFISNMYFWKTSGYFATSAHTKPLIHTWSLSVEEQFYIFAPILIHLIYSRQYARRLYILVALILVSFAISVASVFVAPTAGFFLLPTRAWELFLGVLIALLDKPSPQNRVAREIMAGAGAALIIVGMLTLTEDDPFPGWNALLPCLGAAFCIQAGNRITDKLRLPLVNRLLSAKPLVWIGLISYSLYLVHWPIAAFANYRLLREPTALEGCLMIVVSILLAFLSWKYIEQPFRHIGREKTRTVLIAGACVTVVVCMVGGLGVAVRGLPQRFPDFAEYEIPGVEDWGGTQCFNQDPTKAIAWNPSACTRIHGEKGRILVWGDSFAAQYMPGILRDEKRINADVLQYTFAGCPPILSYFSYARLGCSASNHRIPSIIREQNITIVVLSARWTDVPRRVLSQLPDTIAELNKLGVRVYVLGQSPEFSMDVQHIDYVSGARMKSGTFSWNVFFTSIFNAELARLAEPAIFVDPMLYLCKGQSCPYRKDGDYYFADYGHFSRSGSLRAVSAYFPSGQP